MSTSFNLPCFSNSIKSNQIFVIEEDIQQPQPQLSEYNQNVLPLDWIRNCIPINEFPQVIPWKFPLIYKIGNNGVMYLWQIGFDGEKLLISNGTVGSVTVDPWKITENNSGRTMMEQGYQEAFAKYRNKFYDGYIQVGSNQPPMVKSMKGSIYKQGCIKSFPVYVSPKLDGFRLLVQHMGGTAISCRTRMNRKITHLKLIEEQVIKLFAYLPAYSTLDGELYCHGMTLQEIISAVKTVNFVHSELPKIVFNIFDIFFLDNPPTEIRYEILKSSYNRLQEAGEVCPNLAIVPHYPAHSHEQIIYYKDAFISYKYEGAFVRLCSNGALPGSKEYENSRYKFGRCTRAFKVKDFMDEEGIVVGVVSAQGSETGAALLIIKDKLGIQTAIRFGTIEDRCKWMTNPNLVVDKKFTFKFVKRGETGAPHQPTGVGFRDYE